MTRDEAKEIIKKGCELYHSGEYEKAFPLLVRGADAGFIPAYVWVGDCYWNGVGIEADSTKAIQYYLSAVEMGNTDAMMRMGEVYIRCGDPQKAIDIYVNAADNGVTDALFCIGYIYYSGIGSGERDYATAASYFEKYVGIAEDDANALHLLGRCYVFMKPCDLTKAEKLFEKAALLGNENAAKDRDALQLGGSIIDCY